MLHWLLLGQAVLGGALAGPLAPPAVIEPVTVFDISPRGDALRLTGYRPGGDSEVPWLPLTLRIHRRVPDAWRLPVDSDNATDYVVTAVLRGQGVAGRLRHEDDPRDTLPLTVRATDARLERVGVERFLVGGLEIDLDLGQLEAPGRYRGAVVITVTAR